MVKKITGDYLTKIAALAKIRLTEDETLKFTDDLNAIIEYAEALKSINIDGVEPMISPLMGISAPLREDIVLSGMTQEDALKEASQTEAGHFRVPKTIEGH